MFPTEFSKKRSTLESRAPQCKAAARETKEAIEAGTVEVQVVRDDSVPLLESIHEYCRSIGMEASEAHFMRIHLEELVPEEPDFVNVAIKKNERAKKPKVCGLRSAITRRCL